MARQLTVADREKVLTLGYSRVGVSESPPFSNNVEFSRWWGYRGPWCAMYVSWMYYKALGFSPFPATTSKGFAYCPSGVDWFKGQRQFARRGTRPERGWIIFYDFIGRPSHVGVVLDVLSDGRVHSLEGNTNGGGSRDGGSVMTHNRSLSTVVGYGVLDFANVSTRPAYNPVPFPGQMGPRQGNAESVKVLERQLAKLGLYNHPIDGRWDDSVSAAVRHLKKKYDGALLASGVSDLDRYWGTYEGSVGTYNEIVGPKFWQFLNFLVYQKQLGN